MRDEIDARVWNAHHEAFSADVSERLGRLAGGVQRADRALPMPLKLMAVVLAVSVVTLSAPSPASAQPAQASAERIAIPYSDLNLGSADGRRSLEARVASAARQLCKPHHIVPIAERSRRRACFNEAVADAAPQLRRAFAGRSDGGQAVIVAARR